MGIPSISTNQPTSTTHPSNKRFNEATAFPWCLSLNCSLELRLSLLANLSADDRLGMLGLGAGQACLDVCWLNRRCKAVQVPMLKCLFRPFSFRQRYLNNSVGSLLKVHPPQCMSQKRKLTAPLSSRLFIQTNSIWGQQVLHQI